MTSAVSAEARLLAGSAKSTQPVASGPRRHLEAPRARFVLHEDASAPTLDPASAASAVMPSPESTTPSARLRYAFASEPKSASIDGSHVHQAGHHPPLAVDRVPDEELRSLQQELAQGAACNGAHVVEQRCARWLVMTHNRVGLERVSCDCYAIIRAELARLLPRRE